MPCPLWFAVSLDVHTLLRQCYQLLYIHCYPWAFTWIFGDGPPPDQRKSLRQKAGIFIFLKLPLIGSHCHVKPGVGTFTLSRNEPNHHSGQAEWGNCRPVHVVHCWTTIALTPCQSSHFDAFVWLNTQITYFVLWCYLYFVWKKEHTYFSTMSVISLGFIRLFKHSDHIFCIVVLFSLGLKTLHRAYTIALAPYQSSHLDVFCLIILFD